MDIAARLRRETPPPVKAIAARFHLGSSKTSRKGLSWMMDDVNRQDFLKTLAEACQKTRWQVHAYCLMSKHYHLVLETPEPNLVAGMSWLQSSSSIRLNHRHRLFGHVFRGRPLGRRQSPKRGVASAASG